MKTYKVGILAAAILMVVAGVGFGIAQAAGTYEDRPALSFEDQVAFEQGNSSSPDVLALPSVIVGDHAADGNPSSDVAQTRGPIETGTIPVAVSEESWMMDYGND
jgi:hypothetical protein